MTKSDRSAGRGQSDQQQQLRLPLRELVREALLDTVVISGLEYVGEVLEEERTELCGLRYRHDRERRASRAGSMPSSLTPGRSAGTGGAATGAQLRRPRTYFAELAGVECAGSTGAEDVGADGAGGLDTPLPALAGSAAPGAESTRRKQEPQ